jgi:hypothetical protein
LIRAIQNWQILVVGFGQDCVIEKVVRYCVNPAVPVNTVLVVGHGNWLGVKSNAAKGYATPVAIPCVLHLTTQKSTVVCHASLDRPEPIADMDDLAPDPTCGWQDQILKRIKNIKHGCNKKIKHSGVVKPGHCPLKNGRCCGVPTGSTVDVNVVATA